METPVEGSYLITQFNYLKQIEQSDIVQLVGVFTQHLKPL
jgi:hypothetical protein